MVKLGRKTRFALCLSGQPRSFEGAFPYIKKHILDPNPGTDVFIHCWYDGENAGKPFRETSSGLLGVSQSIECAGVPERLTELYHPVSMVCEPQEDFSARIAGTSEVGRGMVNPFAIFSAWRSAQNCNRLLRAFEEKNGFVYDAIVKTRTDCVVLRDICLDALEPGKFHIHGHEVRGTTGIVDLVYVGTGEQVRGIVDMYEDIERYTGITALWNAEALLMEHLCEEKVPIVLHAWFPIILREGSVRRVIFRGVCTYLAAALKDFAQELPGLKTLFRFVRARRYGALRVHADWLRDKKTGVLERIR